MTVQELIQKMVGDARADFNKPILVYDPTAEDYMEATGYFVRDDGAVVLQTPD